MSSRINTILIIGATAGIGEAFARRFHSMGKKVIATGRNEEKLKAMSKELPGLKTRQFDIGKLDALPGIIGDILKDFPRLDTVLLSAGIQKCFNFFDPSTTNPREIAAEVTTNLSAPAVLVHLLAPHLLQLANSGTKTTMFLTSSTLGYIPLSFYPVYCPTKAGVAALAKVLRQQLSFGPTEARNNMNVVEIVPPYTDTGLDKEHREAATAMQGGPEKAFQPMPLGEFVSKFFEAMENTETGTALKPEIGVGTGQTGVETWRGSFGKVYEQMGLRT
ncbi:NAD(P)-binding protein [Xylariaceae sp. FL0804]|nr:NAD(P)-binding protein [Xylariaceae sp. FL0804]